MDCSQSSSSVVTLYNYQPIYEDETAYFMGSDSFRDNYCWPGFSPFYSYFYQYGNNFSWAIMNIATAMSNLYQTTQAQAEGPQYGYQKPAEDEDRTFYGIDYMTLSYWLVEQFRQGIEHNSQEMEGKIPRRSMDELSQLTSKLMKNKNKK